LRSEAPVFFLLKEIVSPSSCSCFGEFQLGGVGLDQGKPKRADNFKMVGLCRNWRQKMCNFGSVSHKRNMGGGGGKCPYNIFFYLRIFISATELKGGK
jgi:hypothetical protein